jgi:hypothetical protein
VDREIEVITADSVEGSVNVTAEEPEVEALSATTQITQNEGQPEPGGQRPRRLLGAGITQALNDLVVSKSDAGDRIDRNDARHRALSVITQLPSKPVASERRGRHRNSSAIGETEP